MKTCEDLIKEIIYGPFSTSRIHKALSKALIDLKKLEGYNMKKKYITNLSATETVDGYRVRHGKLYCADVYGRRAEELCNLFAASGDLLMWAEDLCERLREKQKLGVRVGADTDDSITMLEKAIRRAHGKK